MRFFKKRAEEYFDELQKEKKLHSELLWEVEVRMCVGVYVPSEYVCGCMYVHTRGQEND